MIRNILIPLDGTEFSEQALPKAIAIGKQLGARLHLVHVHSPVSFMEQPVEQTDEVRREDELEHLQQVADQIRASGLSAEVALIDGPIVEALLRHADRVQADLAILTTHARGPLLRALLGSVSDALFRRIRLPILLLRPSELTTSTAHVLLALDGTDHSESMIPIAMALGESLKAEFTFLRVVEPVCEYITSVEGDSVLIPNDAETRELAAEAQTYLKKVATCWSGRGLKIDLKVVVDDNPASAILETALQRNCDLIALESHGCAGLQRMLVGSVTDQLIRRSTLPILTHVATTQDPATTSV